MGNEWSFFQIEPGTIGEGWTAGDASQQLREPSSKMSNFGALNYGARMAFDYTRTTLEFADKDKVLELTDEIYDSVQGAEEDENPYPLNKTIHRVRDDQFVRMGMSMGGADPLGLNDAPNSTIDQPGADVMDTKVSSGPWVVGINYPTEGWRTFGGKYDFHVPYDGTLR